MAFRAPVLAALFLVVAFATLAMPGSPNFVGEILILFGAFEDKLVLGIVASAGVVLAAVYMIRIFQESMHDRVAEGADPVELSRFDFAMIAPITAVIVALGVYPQVLLDRSEETTTAKVRTAELLADGEDPAAAEVGGGTGGAATPEELQRRQIEQLQQQLQQQQQQQQGQPGPTP